LGITILGTGRYLPDYVASNREYETFLDTSDEWIVTRTGMRERRIALDTPVWKMGELAARQALEAAGVTPDEIDLILCTTVTADYRYPSAACLIQGGLGAGRAFAMDVAAACTGSVYALDLARRYLETGDVDTVLLVSTEALSQATDYTDRGSAILFGDGAAAAVLQKGEGLFASALFSEPDLNRHLYCPLPRQALPFGGGIPAREEKALTFMNGREVYKFAVRVMPAAARAACEKAGIAVEELDLIIPHQANLRIIETAAKALQIPMEKICVNIQKYGNTSSASIPIALDEMAGKGQLLSGDLIIIAGFGAGLTYGAHLIKWTTAGQKK